ncbi:hypothetical protein FA95DRAFT_1140787 [Auriscalpium vulgare]|uniref:Uncharacterized protein n=1 Tax=Auriscalpium vulgare TaxID=40419 RepID=A0ACB8RVC4_9AGAM|nr:hypothetical protein FA95DRAFT_1140787 [Auriscalpium vulgare]
MRYMSNLYLVLRDKDHKLVRRRDCKDALGTVIFLRISHSDHEKKISLILPLPSPSMADYGQFRGMRPGEIPELLRARVVVLTAFVLQDELDTLTGPVVGKTLTGPVVGKHRFQDVNGLARETRECLQVGKDVRWAIQMLLQSLEVIWTVQVADFCAVQVADFCAVQVADFLTVQIVVRVVPKWSASHRSVDIQISKPFVCAQERDNVRRCAHRAVQRQGLKARPVTAQHAFSDVYRQITFFMEGPKIEI